MKLLSEKILAWRIIGLFALFLLVAEATYAWLYGAKPIAARAFDSAGATINLICFVLYIVLVVLLVLRAFYVLKVHRTGWMMRTVIALGLGLICLAQVISMGIGAYDELTLKENNEITLSERFGGDTLMLQKGEIILETPDGIRWHSDIGNENRIEVGNVIVHMDKSSKDKMSIAVYKNPGTNIAYIAYVILLLGVFLWLHQVYLRFRLQNPKRKTRDLSS